jgi:hypothetical protein
MQKCSFALSTLLLAVCVIALGSVNQVIAQEKQEPQERTESQERQDHSANTMQGKVVSVDPAGHQINIRDDQGSEKALQVSPATTISKEGKTIKLSDIKPGDQVQLVYEGTADNPSAKSIVVIPSKSGTP